MCIGHIPTKQETSMTRTSTFAVVTLTAIAIASLAPAGAFAHGGGGGFGGGGFGGGHAGGFSAGGFSAPAAHSFVTFSGSGGYPRLPVASGHTIERSSIIARKPVVPPTGTGGGANSSGHSNIPTTTVISQFPKAPPATGTGGAANSSGHSNIPTTTVISQLPKAPSSSTTTPPPPPPKTGTGPNFGGGVVPVVVPVDGTPDVVAGGDVAAAAVGTDSQPAQATQAAQPVANSSCNCLTKQYLDDGSLLFRDFCTKEAVLVTPAELKAQARNLAR
jgi:hypothetical protein